MLQTLASKHARAREPVGIEAELDEMWGCVNDKETTRWLWHAMDHHTGQMLASVMGSRLKEQHQRLGYDIFCANHRIGPMPSAQSLKSLRLFGKEAVPAFT
jgi:hypothetical protein